MKFLKCVFCLAVTGTLGFFAGRMMPQKWIIPVVGGVTVTAIFVLLLNLSFILIQRYYGPGLLRLQCKPQPRTK